MTSETFGIYIHIPFCAGRCNYCNFFTSNRTLHLLDRYISVLCEEIAIAVRSIIPQPKRCSSLYFGGGTPSLLSNSQLEQIIRRISGLISFEDKIEITLEANPQDLTMKKLLFYRTNCINRLSIGCQSFQDEMLQFLNRRHSSEDAGRAIRFARDAGFNNISADLIFGIPGQTAEMWQYDLNEMLKYSPEHISLYNLTIEAETQLHNAVEKGHVKYPDESMSANLYKMANEVLVKEGYEHYEISNFAKAGCYSRHNTSYWFGKPYYGFGAGAHSFYNDERNWNTKNMEYYFTSIAGGILPKENFEKLTGEQKFLEKVMLSLRTNRGLNLLALDNAHRHRIETNSKMLIGEKDEKLLELNGNRLFIPRSKWIIADEIIARLVQ